jgi:hypothetical protein
MSGDVGTGHSNWAVSPVNRTLVNWFLYTLRYGYTPSDVHLQLGGPPLVRCWELTERDHLEDLGVERR